jgi:riboflavin synthase
MFTGIITDIGSIRSTDHRGDLRAVIGCSYDPDGIDLGASIACSGVCLTVVDKGRDTDGGWFAVDVSGETINCTASGQWDQGRKLNLERALKVGDELGGHIVTGHVDGVGEIIAITPVGDSHQVVVKLANDLAAFVAAKGSITVDGVSLTVNSVTDAADGTRFSLNIIPHTWDVTTFASLSVGQTVNLEIDVLARYLKRMEQFRAA